jgi:hypothetical protein
VKQIAQRPLQEQKGDQRQSEPLGGGHKIADQAIEGAQEDRHVAIPLDHDAIKRNREPSHTLFHFLRHPNFLSPHGAGAMQESSSS